MPQNKKNRSVTVDDEEPSGVQNSSRFDSPISIPPVKVPSVYLGGRDVVEPLNTCSLTSIVCQEGYTQLSPEELRFRDMEIHQDPPRREISYEEEHLRYYPDEGPASVPQLKISPPATAPAISVSSGVKPISSDLGSTFLEFSGPVPKTTVDGESAASICSSCAARLDAGAEGDEKADTSSEGSEGSDRDTPSCHIDTSAKKKRKREKLSRRVRQLEKTVEGLSHGLILALTELQDRKTTADGRKSVNVDALSTALSDLSTVEDLPDSAPGTSAPGATLPQPPSEPPARQRESASQDTSAVGAEHVATENDSSMLISEGRTPISGLLKPILDFMACREVHQLLKQAECHPGLRNTQLFDLLWVANNLFNVHGGIVIYLLHQSFDSMDDISVGIGSNAWSQDPKLMQKLDETYCKHLRPHIDTVGSPNSVAKAAWESYCFELGGIFSKQFPDWESATSYSQTLSRLHGDLGPIITSSYIEDLSASWTEVHLALLEITRWLEPFIDYGPDYHRATPLYDATIALGRHAGDLFNRNGSATGTAMPPTVGTANIMRLLCKHRSGELKAMQREMGPIMNSVKPRDVGLVAANIADGEVAALVDRAKKATLWRVEDPSASQMQDELARREVRMMKSYRPKLLRESEAAARIRREVLDVLNTGPGAKDGEMFWDGCGAGRRSNRRSDASD